MEDQPEDADASAQATLPQTTAADRARAVYALSAAAELLQLAEKKNSESDFGESISFSRDSMRMSSSAILFLGGKVAPDLESSCAYLTEKYDGIVPTDEWRAVERIARDSLPGRLAGLFGGGRQQLGKDASKALEAAAKFFGATSAIVNEASSRTGMAQEGAMEEEEGMEEAAPMAMPGEEAEDIYGEAS